MYEIFSFCLELIWKFLRFWAGVNIHGFRPFYFFCAIGVLGVVGRYLTDFDASMGLSSLAFSQAQKEVKIKVSLLKEQKREEWKKMKNNEKIVK